jgi:hypothetical protein
VKPIEEDGTLGPVTATLSPPSEDVNRTSVALVAAADALLLVWSQFPKGSSAAESIKAQALTPSGALDGEQLDFTPTPASLGLALGALEAVPTRDGAMLVYEHTDFKAQGKVTQILARPLCYGPRCPCP